MLEICKILRETEKAYELKCPYYRKSDIEADKRKQKWITTWVPKSVISQGQIEFWVKKVMKEEHFYTIKNQKDIVLGKLPPKEKEKK